MQQEYEMAMKRLIKTVVRTFYEPCHVVIADILLENILLSDIEFCERMKMINREFNKLMVRLREDRLVKSDIKVEIKENNKQILKTFYFFNYAEVRNIIKYKIYKMTKALEIKNVQIDNAFYCNDCNRQFSALDAQTCMDNFIFKCMFCGTELQENIMKKGKEGVDLKAMLDSIEDVINLLKETEKFTIPSMDYFQILEFKKEKEKEKSECKSDDLGNKIDKYDNKNIFDSKIEFEENSEEFTEVDLKDYNGNKESKIDEWVHVNGIKKNINLITEEDKEMMNEDEYVKYFEAYSKYNR